MVVGALLLPASAAAVPPVGKHYATVLLIGDPINREIEAAPGCLSFTRNELCTETDQCGPWEFVRKMGRTNEWTGELRFVEDGSEFDIQLTGMTERRGPRSSIGGTVVATIDGFRINAAFSGVQVSLAQCLEFGLSDD